MGMLEFTWEREKLTLFRVSKSFAEFLWPTDLFLSFMSVLVLRESR